jgi:hypothetical protein
MSVDEKQGLSAPQGLLDAMALELRCAGCRCPMQMIGGRYERVGPKCNRCALLEEYDALATGRARDRPSDK